VTRSLLALLLVGLTAFAPLGCGKHAYGKDDLQVATGKHYLDLRWGRIRAAAKRVHPDLRKGFIEDWTKRTNDVEIHDLEVVEMDIDEEGDSAEILVSVNWVDRTTMTMQQSTITQKWVRTDDGWVAAEDFKLGVKE
jgi:hypothetical protein